MFILHTLITVYGSCTWITLHMLILHTLITVYGSCMWISPPHVNHPHVKYHTLHMWIIWESTQESHTFHTWIILEFWIGITCFKTLICGSCSHVEGTLIWLPYSSCVATIQLPCSYHTGIMVHHMGVAWESHRSCMVATQNLVSNQEFYGSHTESGSQPGAVW